MIMRPQQAHAENEQITDAELLTLKAIETFMRRHNYPPTVKEIAAERNLAGPSIHAHLNGLARKGYIRRHRRKARGLTVVQRSTDPPTRLVPVTLFGDVAAGTPVLAEQNVIGEVLIDSALTGGGACFALRVRGDSMIKAGIRENDVVIVRQQQLAENGDIVVATLDGESTVKRLSIEEQKIELRPENNRYKPIPIGLTTDFRILGKVVATRRTAS